MKPGAYRLFKIISAVILCVFEGSLLCVWYHLTDCFNTGLEVLFDHSGIVELSCGGIGFVDHFIAIDFDNLEELGICTYSDWFKPF